MSWISHLRDMLLRKPLDCWHCRLCGCVIDQMQLKVNPGEIHCRECKWRLKEATEGRR